MLDPAQPASLYAEIRDLKQRIAALERSPRVSYASITDGSIVLLNSSGEEVVRIGKQLSGAVGVRSSVPGGVKRAFLGSFSDGRTGFTLANEANAAGFEVTAEDGFSAPAFAYSWRSPTAQFATSSATFVDAYETLVTTVTANCLRVPIIVIAADASLAGEVRISTADGNSAVYSFSSVVAGASKTLVWEHPLMLFAGPTIVKVQIRKTGGVGDAIVYEPSALSFQANLPGATTAGAWL